MKPVDKETVTELASARQLCDVKGIRKAYKELEFTQAAPKPNPYAVQQKKWTTLKVRRVGDFPGSEAEPNKRAQRSTLIILGRNLLYLARAQNYLDSQAFDLAEAANLESLICVTHNYTQARTPSSMAQSDYHEYFSPNCEPLWLQFALPQGCQSAGCGVGWIGWGGGPGGTPPPPGSTSGRYFGGPCTLLDARKCWLCATNFPVGTGTCQSSLVN
uniref:Uncharacterized protein n=1 Tax=Eutreptiella gymnastica TaxID=73025 RepID=A0A7S1N8L8_9EUGL|mmetsp:Transcript_137614/g.239256  ORF Transcript_137614/g.239256 Transcript_137614/m.239256 type:complete len:216 (+) Transcript_137614:347-994(+)